jgi:hypothetical protein
MSRAATPWIGLVALAAMFLLPYLPSWLFEGPRTVKHHPRRHVCAECGAPWVAEHACAEDFLPPRAPLRGELRRATRSTTLARRPAQHTENDY